ncbi:synaptophysin / synaptoporin [Ancylostoma duodenale]|uniref:Synaptophysin / synaptoporin n=1 Tax=Ancylostoma duodenale TaxID=51022 RepID=A0A0C2CGF5_9BILA|nr:synaptophysin / synaptoporin [Ancylostoma duodenale]
MHEPRYATTTTVVETTEYMTPRDSSPTYVVGVPAADCSYIRTLGGIMKCVCIALCLLCFLCVLIGGPGYYTGKLPTLCFCTWVLFRGMVANSHLKNFSFLFTVDSGKITTQSILQEMCFYFAWTIFFFIAASVLAVAAARFTATGGWAVAAVRAKLLTLCISVATRQLILDESCLIFTERVQKSVMKHYEVKSRRKMILKF